jgi:hypothetical protein
LGFVIHHVAGMYGGSLPTWLHYSPLCGFLKVRICILHIYILVVSLLPRFGEPLAHALELWFLHVCVRYLLIA